MPAYSPTVTVPAPVETEPTQVTGFALTGRMTTWTCTADGSGNVTFKSGHRFRGELSRVVIDPRVVGAASINLKVNDSHGLDLLGGAASAASASANTQWPGVGTVDHKQVVDEQLWIIATGLNAGDTFVVFAYEI